MQFGSPPVTGVVCNTTMSRPDAALSLALLWGLEGKREARVASIAITENSFGAAAFADAVCHFYQIGPAPNSNRMLVVGLAADKPLPPDSPAVRSVLERVNDKGEPLYKRGVRRVTDTSEVTALMRNSMTYFQDGRVVVVLSAPATYLARVLDYAGTKELIRSKVRSLVVSECRQDAAAMKRILAEWPTPIVFCGREVGEALPYPGTSMDQDFAWTQAHPVVDFYRAANATPYDTPAQDLAAIYYAAKPDSGLLELSDAGTLDVLADGALRFTSGPDGKHKRIVVDPAKRSEILTTFRQLVSAKPVPPPARRRFTAEEIEKLRQQREEEQKKRELEERKLAAPAPTTRP